METLSAVADVGTLHINPEWCEHAPKLVVHEDGRKTLRCQDCGFVIHEWEADVRLEHFDHG